MTAISPEKQNIIDNQTLYKLNEIQGKNLQYVVCYLWINQINPKEPIDLIDAVEFIFSDGSKITLSGNEYQEGLMAIEYNFEQQKQFLEREFQGKIKIYKVNASNTDMWKSVIDQKIINIRLTKDKTTNQYLSDEIIVEFENKEMRLIQVHPVDGVILDYYEEI
ncbi:MAG: hypothetical protein D6799_02110 [Bacteroidetes bacterium]|nr:MAG: hypothetical protein D6799_02110 [Bacteroidota bacterium]